MKKQHRNNLKNLFFGNNNIHYPLMRFIKSIIIFLWLMKHPPLNLLTVIDMYIVYIHIVYFANLIWTIKMIDNILDYYRRSSFHQFPSHPVPQSLTCSSHSVWYEETAFIHISFPFEYPREILKRGFFSGGPK